MLISCAVTAQLICVFVFAYAKSHFSHNEAQLWWVFCNNIAYFSIKTEVEGTLRSKAKLGVQLKMISVDNFFVFLRLLLIALLLLFVT